LKVQLGALSFHYLEDGRPGAPPVVLLHGLASHAYTWTDLTAALRDRFRVLALDQRGHGDSDHADEYGSRPMVDDLGRFVDALGLERFVLVGSSMGGINAYCYAGAHPERVERLVVIDIGPQKDRTGMRRIADAALLLDTFDTVDDAIALQRGLNPDALEDALRFRTEHNLRPTADGRFTWKYDMGMRDGSKPQRNFSADEQWDRWRRVRCPTLLVRAERSDLLSDEVATRMLAEQPLAELVTIPGSGHIISLEAPKQLAEVVNDWLGQPRR
jgi:pimeloyl-ACP methyl ester carboxylesterase